MQHQECASPKALRDCIQGFWYTSKDFGELPVRFEIVPAGYAEIIFHFGSADSSLTAASKQLLSAPFLVGLLDKPVCFFAKNQVEIIGIRCFSWAVFEVLGLPPGKDGVRVMEHPIARLHATLAAGLAAGNIAQALAQAGQYLRRPGRRRRLTSCSAKRAGRCGPPKAPYR